MRFDGLLQTVALIRYAIPAPTIRLGGAISVVDAGEVTYLPDWKGQRLEVSVRTEPGRIQAVIVDK